MAVFEVILTQKTKRIVSAENATDALAQAIADVVTENKPFTPVSWSVKEKEQGE
jgi:hypothetical protein